MIGTKIHITGIVQGVGFRPFVYNLAHQQGLTGWICNTSAGVDIEINGDPDDISHFIHRLNSDIPPLAHIDSINYQQVPAQAYDKFEIIHSKEISHAFQPISPDIGICDDCLQELFDPSNQRYRYPFINCTNCGPRLTIIEEIPYDRPNTTMRDFVMCPECENEYTNPSNRRFHAQPIACPVCGPKVWLEYTAGKDIKQGRITAIGDESIISVQNLLKKGKIIAIKGLGGFHLACDATNSKAVAELRQRKLRVDKPFALMMPDMDTIEANCLINDEDRHLLQSVEKPIVIIQKRDGSHIANIVAPNQNTVGVMLPYTPLHYLLFASTERKNINPKDQRTWSMPPLVMTSGNLSEEPIAINNDDARERLSSLADAYLMHDRTIRTRCDDSVMRIFRGATMPIRRSRGYAPYPVYLKDSSPHILAVGAELKNTFCITRDHYAFVSQHVGDMENIETFDSFVDSISRYEALFRLEPEAIAYDLHPHYMATRYALERSQRENLPSFGIQHHHAHIASCLAENSINSNRPVIGVAFDGTGYGDDGAIWGGEFMLADYRGYRRICHLKYIPLPGGDTAIRKPARTALAYLWSGNMDWELNYHPVKAICVEERAIIKSQLDNKINTPLTSSMGRFFDAVASLTGVRQQVNYEAQAAIEFEAMVDAHENNEYEFPIEDDNKKNSTLYQINPLPLIESLLMDVQRQLPISTISAKVHNSIARMVNRTCIKIRSDFGINDVVLSGGVWQNVTLLRQTFNLLQSDNFNIYVHKQVPTNDGGLSLGQAVIALHRLIN